MLEPVCTFRRCTAAAWNHSRAMRTVESGTYVPLFGAVEEAHMRG